MTIDFLGTDLVLSPRARAAPGSIRRLLHGALAAPKRLDVASQQLSDAELTTALATAALPDGQVRMLIERDYLLGDVEDAADIWVEDGKRELSRQCLLAALRAGWNVRTDHSSALQHANFAIHHPDDQDAPCAVLTSANFASGSIDRHFNWGVKTELASHIEALSEAFDQAWDGDFGDINISTAQNIDEPTLRVSSTGAVLEDIAQLVIDATTTINFAFFNISTSSDIVDHLTDAAARGVAITGIVDGDQARLRWDAVPSLRDAGINVRYYPGQLTGATGRMHYKMLTIDDRAVHVGTSNISKAALRSLELGLSSTNAEPTAAKVTAEVRRLHTLAPSS